MPTIIPTSLTSYGLEVVGVNEVVVAEEVCFVVVVVSEGVVIGAVVVPVAD